MSKANVIVPPLVENLWTLFDTGSKNTYITQNSAEGLPQQATLVPRRVGLGGVSRVLDRFCDLRGYIANRPIEIQAYVTDGLGTDESGRTIDVLFGALGMQQWHIHVRPDEERLDLSHYPTEFIEY